MDLPYSVKVHALDGLRDSRNNKVVVYLGQDDGEWVTLTKRLEAPSSLGRGELAESVYMIFLSGNGNVTTHMRPATAKQADQAKR